MAKKIAWVTNSPSQYTGFGTQAKLVIDQLNNRGYENVVICRPHPAITGAYNEVQIENYVWEGIDEAVSRIQPDAVICFEGHQLLLNLMGMRITPANCPVYFWWPFEGSAVPRSLRNSFEGVPQNHIIHLSNFAKDMWGGEIVIPHAVEAEFQKLPDQKSSLKKKWAKRLKLPIFTDSTLVLNVNRNFFHKGWDELFYTISLVKDKMDVQLLCVTSKVFPEDRGGFDLVALASQYGISDEVMFITDPLTTKDLNEIYNAADVVVNLTHGEGFGLSILSAKAAGTPQILNNTTTVPEITGPFGEILVTPASYSYRMGTLWGQPDCNQVAAELLKFNGGEVAPPSSRFDLKGIVDAWEQVLNPDKPYRGWAEHRYGYQAKNGVTVANQTAAKLCKAMGWSAMVPGAYDGSFLHWAEVFGVTATCTEQSANAAAPAYRQYPEIHESYSDGWVDADVLVLTNVQDIMFGDASAEEVAELMEKVQGFDNILLLAEPCYKWGHGRFNPDQLKTYLSIAGLKRFAAYEHMIRKKMPNFAHEIWAKSFSIPESLK